MAKIVRTSIRMDARLHGRASDFVHEMKKRQQKVSMDWLVQHAVDSWLKANDPTHAVIPPPQFELEVDPRLAPWVEMLQNILRSNHQVAIDAITRTLQAFQELTSTSNSRGRAAVVMTPEEIIEWSREFTRQYRDKVKPETLAG